MTQVPLYDRFEGCLIGLALGDALGAPYEFSEAPEVDATKFSRGFFGTEPGHPTDDSTLATLLAESLVKWGALNADDYMRRLMRWLASGPPDVGNQTAQAILHYKKTGTFIDPNENACGNGSLMACAPLGLLYAGRGRHAADVGAEFSKLTHPSSRSEAAVGFLVQSIARLVVDPRAIPPCDAQVKVPACFAPTRDAIGLVTWCAALAYQASDRCEAVADAFPQLVWVIEQGGDTDTNAAVAGALLGARFGMNAWPTKLVRDLKLTPELTKLAHQLYTRASAHVSTS